MKGDGGLKDIGFRLFRAQRALGGETGAPVSAPGRSCNRAGKFYCRAALVTERAATAEGEPNG